MSAQGPCDEAGNPGSVRVAVEEDFESYLDVPYVSLTRLGTEALAHISMGEDDDENHTRLRLALTTAARNGLVLTEEIADPGESQLILKFQHTGGPND